MTKKTRVWLSTTEAAAELGCSAKYLRENRDNVFKRGTHYRVLNPNAWRPTYRWHIKKIQKLMEA